MPELRDLDPTAVARLLVAAGAYRTLHGTGATWAQASRAAGWAGLGYQERGRRFAILRRAGFVTFTRQTRSLAVTSAGASWALATLSPGRAARRRALR
jgi:hypothetical protein